MKTFDIFIAEKFAHMSPMTVLIYEDLASFKRSHIDQFGLSLWLANHVAGTHPNVADVESIVETYVDVCGMDPKSSNGIVANVARVLNVTLPDVDGLLTPEYWQDHFTLRRVAQQQPETARFFLNLRRLRVSNDGAMLTRILSTLEKAGEISQDEYVELDRIISSRLMP